MNPMRITGFSGLDTENWVNELMKAARIPLDKKAQEKQKWEWRREDYRDINMKLLALKNKSFDMRLTDKYKVYSTSSSDDKVLIAEANAGAAQGTYDVHVKELAKSASVASGRFNLTDTIDGKFEINVPVVNEDGTPDNKTIFSFDGSTEGDFSKLLEKLKENQDVFKEHGLKISIDEYEGKAAFAISTIETGSKSQFTLNCDKDFDNNNPNCLQHLFGIQKAEDQIINGQNAQIYINGLSIERDTNNFTFEGITYNLKNTGSSRIAVSQNTEQIYENIKEYIDLYNETLELINGKVDETRPKTGKYGYYEPLTAEQKESMNEDDIKKWEEAAKKGLLRSDPLLNTTAYAMRNSMVPSRLIIKGESRSLSQIGITTGSYLEKGKLYINEDKLKKAIEEDPEGVMALFKNAAEMGPGENPNTIKAEDGIAIRLYKSLTGSIDDIKEKAGAGLVTHDDSFIGKKLKYLDEEMDKLNDRLERLESRYWQQFTAMEKALNSMNQQSAWLMQQLGGGM